MDAPNFYSHFEPQFLINNPSKQYDKGPRLNKVLMVLKKVLKDDDGVGSEVNGG